MGGGGLQALKRRSKLKLKGKKEEKLSYATHDERHENQCNFPWGGLPIVMPRGGEQQQVIVATKVY